MTSWICLLRGINVGGKHSLPMKELRALLERNGCANVQTYIQSGNAVFESKESDPAKLGKKIAGLIEKSHGFEPRVMMLTHADLKKAAAANPFPQADENPKSLHLFFLSAKPTKPNLEAIDALRANREEFVLKGTVFYLHTPNGFGTSKVAERAERLLGVDATARNWRTVTTLLDMAKAK